MRRVLIAADLLLICFLFLSFFLSFIKKSIAILQRKDQPSSSSSKTACHTSSTSFAGAALAVRKEAAIW
jgi:hypothetical protein